MKGTTRHLEVARLLPEAAGPVGKLRAPRVAVRTPSPAGQRLRLQHALAELTAHYRYLTAQPPSIHRGAVVHWVAAGAQFPARLWLRDSPEIELLHQWPCSVAPSPGLHRPEAPDDPVPAWRYALWVSPQGLYQLLARFERYAKARLTKAEARWAPAFNHTVRLGLHGPEHRLDLQALRLARDEQPTHLRSVWVKLELWFRRSQVYRTLAEDHIQQLLQASGLAPYATAWQYPKLHTHMYALELPANHRYLEASWHALAECSWVKKIEAAPVSSFHTPRAGLVVTPQRELPESAQPDVQVLLLPPASNAGGSVGAHRLMAFLQQGKLTPSVVRLGMEQDGAWTDEAIESRWGQQSLLLNELWALVLTHERAHPGIGPSVLLPFELPTQEELPDVVRFLDWTAYTYGWVWFLPSGDAPFPLTLPLANEELYLAAQQPARLLEAAREAASTAASVQGFAEAQFAVTVGAYEHDDSPPLALDNRLDFADPAVSGPYETSLANRRGQATLSGAKPEVYAPGGRTRYADQFHLGGAAAQVSPNGWLNGQWAGPGFQVPYAAGDERSTFVSGSVWATAYTLRWLTSTWPGLPALANLPPQLRQVLKRSWVGVHTEPAYDASTLIGLSSQWGCSPAEAASRLHGLGALPAQDSPAQDSPSRHYRWWTLELTKPGAYYLPLTLEQGQCPTVDAAWAWLAPPQPAGGPYMPAEAHFSWPEQPAGMARSVAWNGVKAASMGRARHTWPDPLENPTVTALVEVHGDIPKGATVWVGGWLAWPQDDGRPPEKPLFAAPEE